MYSRHQDGDDLKPEYVVYGVLLFFLVSEITVAPRQRLKEVEKYTAERLALVLNACTRSECETHLTLKPFVKANDGSIEHFSWWSMST